MEKKICCNFKKCNKRNIVEGYKLLDSYGRSYYWCKDCLLDYAKTAGEYFGGNLKMKPLRDTNIERYHEVQKDPRFVPAAYEPWD